MRELGAERVRGKVVRRGAEHYARLGFGQRSPELGRTVDLLPGARGAQALEAGRGAERGL